MKDRDGANHGFLPYRTFASFAGKEISDGHASCFCDSYDSSLEMSGAFYIECSGLLVLNWQIRTYRCGLSRQAFFGPNKLDLFLQKARLRQSLALEAALCASCAHVVFLQGYASEFSLLHDQRDQNHIISVAENPR